MDRLKILRIIVLVIFVVLISRAAYLQVYRGDYFLELSEGNRISVRPINAPRGKIYDSRGEVIVSNRLTYNLYLMPNEIPPDSSAEETLSELAELSTISKERLLNNYNQAEISSYAEPVLLARHLSKENMVIIAENSDLLPGLLVKESSLRDYIYPETLVHATGYIGEINLNELKRFNSSGYNYRPGDFVGKSGLEKEYEFYLDGVQGAEQIEVDSRGAQKKVLGIRKPEQGDNLILNIDFQLQKAAERVLSKHYKELQQEAEEDEERSMPTGAAAVVMEINTGKVLASASVPDFDLNLFAKGISSEDYRNLSRNPTKPMLNRTIMSAFPPGSIFKLVTGTAAMEELGVRANTSFYDGNAAFYLPNWSIPFRNWNPVGEGQLDFVKAIARSNNIVFYELGYELYKKFGGDKLAEYARSYGLGQKTQIDLPEEKSGLVPDDQWKRKNLNQGWYPGDSVNLSIGQGSLLTTPVQIAEFISAVASEGKAFKPHLVDRITSPEGETVKNFEPELKIDLENEVSERTFNALKQGMHDVVNKDYGTAHRHFAGYPITVAGKTGTAQTGSELNNHGWFGGFAPFEDPEIVVVVLLENGGSSAYSVPIAREIMDYYFGFRNFNNGAENIFYYSQNEE